MKEPITGSFPYLPDEDRFVIEHKYHDPNAPFDGKFRMAYHGYAYDSATGLDDREILEKLAAISAEMAGADHSLIKARMFATLCDETQIDVNPNDYFVGIWSWGRLLDQYTVDPWLAEVTEKVKTELGNNQKQEFLETGAAWIVLDFDHTVPDWDSLATLGFRGILDRLESSYAQARSQGEVSDTQEIFYQSVKTEYEAILRLCSRLGAYASRQPGPKAELIAEAMQQLVIGPPRNTFEMLELMYLYFMVSESVEHYQVRSLGYGLDGSLYPFFRKDLENGTFTKEELIRFIAYFLMQFSAMGNYWGQPFYLGGTFPDGSTRVNELSELILDIYDTLDLYNPKIQIKVRKDAPPTFIKKALDMIIGGTTSIVFINEDTMVKAMMRSGATYEEAIDSVVKGCYEYARKAASIGISFNTFNALKPIVWLFHRGVDPTTGKQMIPDPGDVAAFTSFADFYRAYLTAFGYVIDACMAWIEQLERYIHQVNPTLLYSGTIPTCVQKLQDANDGGILNVSDMLLNGLGSAVDALMAVYELVYQTQTVTITELKTALDADWVGYEALQKKALSAAHKYGCGDRLADFYAASLHNFFADRFHGKKNGHGDNYEYELHSALAFIAMGKATEATPDGRNAGDHTSKNGSPSTGMDKRGITALIRSATTPDLSLSDSGACLDCMLHPTTVQGEGGVEVLYGVLQSFLSLGGASIHFNIFNAETLRDAQSHPEKYQNLQVRVCGWNVLWNNLSKTEQDAYILRAETIAE